MSKTINYSEVLKSKRLMVGVLSVSFLLSAGNAVSGTIPAMEEAFSNISKANIETLTTIPTAGIMLGTVLSGVFSNYLGKKKSVLAGFDYRFGWRCYPRVPASILANLHFAFPLWCWHGYL